MRQRQNRTCNVTLKIRLSYSNSPHARRQCFKYAKLDFTCLAGTWIFRTLGQLIKCLITVVWAAWNCLYGTVCEVVGIFRVPSLRGKDNITLCFTFVTVTSLYISCLKEVYSSFEFIKLTIKKIGSHIIIYIPLFSPRNRGLVRQQCFIPRAKFTCIVSTCILQTMQTDSPFWEDSFAQRTSIVHAMGVTLVRQSKIVCTDSRYPGGDNNSFYPCTDRAIDCWGSNSNHNQKYYQSLHQKFSDLFT